MKKYIPIYVCLSLLTVGIFSFSKLSYAQNTSKSLEDSIPDSLIKQDNSFLTLTVENDLFGGGTDENYTSGVRLTYFDDHTKSPKIIETLGKSIPFIGMDKITNVYYSLGQNLYTPEIITTQNPNPKDRPYAALLYGSVGYSTLSDNHIDDLEVTLGVVGPAATGEQTQKTIHKWINSPDPKGWGRQLKNEPALILAYQRRWPVAYSAEFNPFFFRIAPHAGVTLGNIYTYANTGVTFQLVPKRHKWQATPARVRPAIPGSGYFVIPDNEFSWSLFAGIDARAIARNIFLDGNTFENSPSVDKKHGVLDTNAGFTITYGRTQIAYTLNWRSDEFEGQKNNSIFGSLSLGYRF